jgi:hypothetical protein
LENLEEMDKFLYKYGCPKLNQDTINHLNRSITLNEIEAAVIFSPPKKSLGPDRFSLEFYQTFKEELIPIHLKLFHEIERDGTQLYSFYENNIILMPKPDKDISKKDIYRQVFLDEHTCKIPQQSNGKLNSTTYQKDHSP